MTNNPWPRRLLHVAGYVTVFGVGIGIGAAGGDEDRSGSAAAEPAPAVTVTADPAPTATITASPTITAEPPAPAADITNGVWLVGEDIEPGIYRTVDAVSADCYWEISTLDGEIVENDIPGGGRPTVTLDDGQQFTSNGCGDWAKS